MNDLNNVYLFLNKFFTDILIPSYEQALVLTSTVLPLNIVTAITIMCVNTMFCTLGGAFAAI